MISADLDALQVRVVVGGTGRGRRTGLWEGAEPLHPTDPLQAPGAGAGTAVSGAGWRGEEGRGLGGIGPKGAELPSLPRCLNKQAKNPTQPSKENTVDQGVQEQLRIP